LIPTGPLAGKKNPNANEDFDWPRTSSDPSVSKVPILADQIVGTSGNKNLSQATGGHSRNGRVVSVNLLYGDGHVESKSAAKIQWRWVGGANFVAFY
jgi:prepilin-type processing-associated H-X9-DG protein